MNGQDSTQNAIVKSLFGLGVLALVVVLLAVLPRMVGERSGDDGNAAKVPPHAPAPVMTTEPIAAMVMTVHPTIVPVTETPIPPSATPNIVVPEQLLERDYGIWRFKAARHRDFGAGASVVYDKSSVASLHIYAEANRLLADQLATGGGEAEAYVTFRTYQSPEEFRAWVKAKDVRVVRSLLRTVEPGGNLGTVGQGTHPGDTEPLPQDRLDEALIRGPRDPRATLRGLYFSIITVDAARLPEIAGDPLVFLADVTPNVVRNELAAAGWDDLEHTKIRVSGDTPFYLMEEFGLANFAR